MYTHSFGLNPNNYNKKLINTNDVNHRNYNNNNDKTKNEQLKIVLDSIINENNPELTTNILNYTINIISGNSKNNTSSILENHVKLKNAINFLTANSSKYFPQNITRGAVQIIFVACYSLVKQNTLALSNRNSKINLVNDTIRKMRNDVVINFPNKEYFDIININKEGLNISGNGYNYTSRVKNTQEIGNFINSNVVTNLKKPLNDEDNKDNEENFQEYEQITVNGEIATGAKHLEYQETQRLITGRLMPVEFNKIIQSKINNLYINVDTSFDSQIIIKHMGKKIVIKDSITGKESINKILKNEELYNEVPNDLVLIPYGITNRGFGRENHFVLAVIYQGKLTIIDPKSISDSQIIESPCTVKTTNLQKWYDTTNCTRYTAYTIIKLCEEFNNSNFNLDKFCEQIKKPNLSELQKEYYKNIIN